MTFKFNILPHESYIYIYKRYFAPWNFKRHQLSETPEEMLKTPEDELRWLAIFIGDTGGAGGVVTNPRETARFVFLGGD